MIVTDAIPLSGQFVALWFDEDGVPWSYTLKWDGGVPKTYNSLTEEWVHEFDYEYLRGLLDSMDATFYR